MNSQRLYRLLAWGAFALAAAGAETALAQTGGTVIGTGGGHAANESFRVNGTVGQSIVGRVAAGAAGASQGFWRGPSGSSQNDAVNSPTTGEAVVSLTGAPNPFAQFSELTMRNLTPGRITLDLYDAAGAHVATLLDEIHKGGSASARLEGTELASGNYTAVLVNGNVRRALIVRVVK